MTRMRMLPIRDVRTALHIEVPTLTDILLKLIGINSLEERRTGRLETKRLEPLKSRSTMIIEACTTQDTQWNTNN